MANLGLIVSNYRPFREDRDPRTWMLYKDKNLIDVHGAHGSQRAESAFDAEGISS